MIGTNAPVEERDEKGEMESSEQVLTLCRHSNGVSLRFPR